jgi:hypothetical protein
MEARWTGPHQVPKQLDMRYFEIKELVDRSVVRLVHQGTETMVADILTKPLGPDATRMLQGPYPGGAASMTKHDENKTDDEADNQQL